MAIQVSKTNLERMLIEEANAALNARIKENTLKQKRSRTIGLFKEAALNRKKYITNIDQLQKQKQKLEQKLKSCHQEKKRLQSQLDSSKENLNKMRYNLQQMKTKSASIKLPIGLRRSTRKKQTPIRFGF